MSAANSHYRIPFDGSNLLPPANRLVMRVRNYLDQHPKVSREEFLVDAVRWSAARPRLTAEDLRLHAWLAERLAVLHYERHGLWPRLRRFLFANRLVRWLRLQDRGVAIREG